MNGIVCLCGWTARSSAYLQRLSHEGLRPDYVVMYGPVMPAPKVERSTPFTAEVGLYCPAVDIDLEAWLADSGWPVIRVEDKALDGAQLAETLISLAPKLLIYSGYGGQIVPASLTSAYDVLHVHSGALPEYRGSTTLYYQLLEEGSCAATAILLDEQIDTGPVLYQKRFAMPPAGIDIDYLYDNAIRADVLCETLKCWQNGTLLPQVQSAELPAYFIIHPLLKHLAILRVDLQAQTGGKGQESCDV